MAGATAKSREALKCVRRQCDARVPGGYLLKVIDVYQQPELARIHQIVATPTLVRYLPQPICKCIGNLSDIAHLFTGIGLALPDEANP
jgi:circadian clock protein KaiB